MIDGERSVVSPRGIVYKYYYYYIILFLFSRFAFLDPLDVLLLLLFYSRRPSLTESCCRIAVTALIFSLCFFAPFHFLYELFGKCSNPTGRSFDKLRQQRKRNPLRYTHSLFPPYHTSVTFVRNLIIFHGHRKPLLHSPPPLTPPWPHCRRAPHWSVACVPIRFSRST